MTMKVLLRFFICSHFLALFVHGDILEAIRESQWLALDSFYNAVGYYTQDSIRTNESEPWSGASDEYCDHSGLICDNEGFILSIDLRESSLNGTIPSEIHSLVRLRALRLNDNSLFGALPESLLELSGLRYLNLGRNLFEGTFPDITGLTSLRRLILDRNAFSGTIPNEICHLHNLEVLDLSACTKLHGTIPSCLGNLTALNVLRITNIGLTGAIPPDLCDGREMNGLDPNPFGCAAIGCNAGYYNRNAGRQTDQTVPCSPCSVPSNALGSSTCQWVSESGRTENDDTKSDMEKGGRMSGETGWPTTPPTYGKPSKSPATAYPTQSPHVEMKSSIMPSLGTTIQTLQPLTDPIASNDPSLQSKEPASSTSTAPSLPPTDSEAPTGNIFVLVASEAKENPSTGGLVGGSATAGAFVLIFLLFILSRQGTPKYFVRAENEDEPQRFLVQNVRETTRQPSREPVLLNVDSPVLSTLRSPDSLSTIEEEDSLAVSPSNSLEGVFKQSSITQPTSPPNLRETRSTKKVRFAFPPALEMNKIPSKDSTRDVEAARDEPSNAFGDVNRWASWIMNPVFDAPNICSSAAKPPLEDERSWHSLEAASTNSETPMLNQIPSDAESSSTIVSMRVLGIQERTDDHGGPVTLTETSSRPVKVNRKPAPSLASHNNEASSKNASRRDMRLIWRRKGMAEI